MTEAVRGLTSIVVIAADSGMLLTSSIESALSSDAGVELILVDNASTDGAVERTRSRFGADLRLRVIRNATNVGFGPACNIGAAAASGDVLVFLNPDCILQPSTIGALRETLELDPLIGMLGVTVCDAGGFPARANRRRDPDLSRALATVCGLSRLQGRWPRLAGVEMPARKPGAASPGAAAIEEVDAVSGACMCVPRSAFERVQGFDPGYFLHVEDLDICRRIRDAGLKVAIVHTLRVVHVQGSSSRRRPLFVALHKHRGMWRYFRKFDPVANWSLARGLVWLALWSHFVVSIPTVLMRASRKRIGPPVE